MVAMLALTATGALAQSYPPPASYSVTCTTDGDTIVCAVVGATGNESLEVTGTCDGDAVETTTITADAAGEASFSFTAPAGADDCSVAVLGAESGSVTTEVDADADADDDADDDQAGDPVSPDGDDQLPFTGGEVGTFLAVGIVLLGGGLLTLRRREDAKITG